MRSHTTAVREVLQWTTELARIRTAREVELGESPKNRLAQYKAAVTTLQQVEDEDVSRLIGRVGELDRDRCRQRLEQDKTLEKWAEFIDVKKGSCNADKDFQKAQSLVEQASSAEDPLQAQQSLAEARKLLWESKSVGIAQDEIPFVPGGQSRRGIDPKQAAAALKRKDLRKHIARNDTWGNFDPEKALGEEASEQDLKVLLNIIESAIQADEEDARWKEYEGKVTEAIKKRGHDKSQPIKVYKEIIVGAGASAAYHIASNFGKFDIPGTMVLGTLQPWAEERGKEGKVNHPHNMIDPQQGREPIEKDGSLADRAEFSKRIAEVIAEVPHIQAKVSKVSRCEGDFFEVETDQGKYYARKVTNALGIGKQKAPGPIENESLPSVKDMDSFKRSLDGGKSIREVYGEKIKSVAVVGGNAAIDVVTTVLRDKNMETDDKLQIHWLVGESGPPAFLRGTDNALAEEAYPTPGELSEKPVQKGNMTVYKGYFAKASGSGPIVVDYTCSTKPMPSITVDLVVYGVGPDVEAMQKMFVDETKGGSMALEPVVDKDRHYNVELEEKDPAKLLEKLKDKLPKEREKVEKLLQYLQDPSLKDVADNKGDVVIGVKSQDPKDSQSSMQFVGASGARLKVDSGKSTPMSSTKHETIASLPENVVGNDQLAASRSRIEAQFNALPTSTDEIPLVSQPGGVNFITSNQTVIRVHIAECYPNIPPGLGDYITGQIIHARSLRPKKGDKTETPIPVPVEDDDKYENLSLEQQVAFQEKWTKRLQEIDSGLE